MKEITKINDTFKQKQMSYFNIIIYGTIRDIENDFFTSFLNLDIISEMFNEVYIIIFENDSRDKTRELLQKWYKIKQPKITKHIILKDNLDNIYPLRAHRLAYCRNYILNYIIDNNLHHHYQYAIHCDLDDRFWGVNFDSIKTCFQYNLTEWDVMTCVNKNVTYYDYWALRCEKSWFNINIFSCNANNVDYHTKTADFETLLKNTTGLISVNSSFNGFGIYKISSLINCRYNARYQCEKCNNINSGCWEDNDHIGLHKQIINNNGKIFINNQMFIQTRPEGCILYQNFIKSFESIQNINKPFLQYLFINNLINNDGKWFIVGISDYDNINTISNYCLNKVYVFDENNPSSYFYFNNNVIFKNGSLYKSIYEIQNNDKTPINFLYVDFVNYSLLVELFHNIYNKITKGTIIVFNKLINFTKFWFYNLKALYEFTQEYKITFELLYMGKINTKSMDENESVAIRILENKYFNTEFSNINYSSVEYEKFNWIFYTNKYTDLNQIKTKEQAYIHWINYGSFEGRICSDGKEKENQNTVNDTRLLNKDEENIFIDSFDWETYVELNTDLKELGVKDRDVAYEHWINHGKKEGRLYSFDWCNYIKNYNLVNQSIDTKTKAIEHWLNSGKPDYNNGNINYEEELFDWEYYVKTHNDLSHIKNKNQAWSHWITYGKSEGRKTTNFKWTNYLLANNDLVNNGINTESLALYHWVNHGKKENRKMC